MGERGATHPLVTKVDDLRVSLGVSQEAMALAVGVSKVTYYGWLRGVSRPTPMNQKSLIKGARILMTAARCGDLPVKRELGLPAIEYRNRIKDTILRYMDDGSKEEPAPEEDEEE